MPYTGSTYFMQVRTSNGDSSVRDKDINDLLSAKGSILIAADNAIDGLANFSALPIGSSGQVLSVNNGAPAWTSASAAAGVNDATLYLQVGSGSTAKLFSANAAEDNTLTISSAADGSIIIGNGSVTASIPVVPAELTSTNTLETALLNDGFAKLSDIGNADLVLSLNSVTSTLFTANTTVPGTLSFAEGSTNGAIAVNGTAIPVHGLGSAAFAETSDFDAAGAAADALDDAKDYADGVAADAEQNAKDYADSAAADALQDAKDYADEKIGDLGHVMSVVGTGATPTAYTTPVQGDVYIVNSGDDAGKEYVYTGSAWELLGMNEIDLSEYAKTEDLGGLSEKDYVSIPANSFMTGLSATTTAETFQVLQASAATITDFSGGSVSYNPPSFTVSNGVLSLVAATTDVAFTPATLSYSAVAPSSLTVTHNSYSAVKNAAMTIN